MRAFTSSTRLTAMIAVVGLVPLVGCRMHRCGVSVNSNRLSCPCHGKCHCGRPDAHGPGAYFSLIPARPPSGEYPAGTQLRGNEIVIPVSEADDEVVAYFDVVVRDWGSDDVAGQSEPRRVRRVAMREPGSCDYFENGTGRCSPDMSKGDCESKRCSKFREGGSCNDDLGRLLMFNKCIDGVDFVPVVEETHPPESICDPGLPVHVEPLPSPQCCGQWGGPMLSDVRPVGFDELPCLSLLKIAPGSEGPMADRGESGCLATIRVATRAGFLGPQVQRRTLRVRLAGPGDLAGLPRVRAVTGEELPTAGVSPAFLTLER